MVKSVLYKEDKNGFKMKTLSDCIWLYTTKWMKKLYTTKWIKKNIFYYFPGIYRHQYVFQGRRRNITNFWFWVKVCWNHLIFKTWKVFLNLICIKTTIHIWGMLYTVVFFVDMTLNSYYDPCSLNLQEYLLLVMNQFSSLWKNMLKFEREW